MSAVQNGKTDVFKTLSYKDFSKLERLRFFDFYGDFEQIEPVADKKLKNVKYTLKPLCVLICRLCYQTNKPLFEEI